MADSTDEAYDKAQRMLVFESRAQPGERSRTAAETALLDAERLQKLERERIRRMHSRGDDDEDEEEEDTRARNGG